MISNSVWWLYYLIFTKKWPHSMFRKAFGSTLLYLAAVSFSYLLLWHLAFGSLRWIAAPSSLDQLNIAMKSSRMSLTWSASDDPNASGQVRSTNFLYWAPRWHTKTPREKIAQDLNDASLWQVKKLSCAAFWEVRSKPSITKSTVEKWERESELSRTQKTNGVASGKLSFAHSMIKLSGLCYY